MVVIASTLSQPKMYEAGRVETDSQKEFIIAGQDNNIPDADATTNDQPFPEVGDQSETDDYKGFFDLGLIPQVVAHIVPLSVVYPHSYFEGDIPQGTNSDIESDDAQLNT